MKNKYKIIGMGLSIAGAVISVIGAIVDEKSRTMIIQEEVAKAINNMK